MPTLITGGFRWGSGIKCARAPLNSSRSITSVTAPMVRLPTYTSRCFLPLAAPPINACATRSSVKQKDGTVECERCWSTLFRACMLNVVCFAPAAGGEAAGTASVAAVAAAGLPFAPGTAPTFSQCQLLSRREPALMPCSLAAILTAIL